MNVRHAMMLLRLGNPSMNRSTTLPPVKHVEGLDPVSSRRPPTYIGKMGITHLGTRMIYNTSTTTYASGATYAGDSYGSGITGQYTTFNTTYAPTVSYGWARDAVIRTPMISSSGSVSSSSMSWTGEHRYDLPKFMITT